MSEEPHHVGGAPPCRRQSALHLSDDAQPRDTPSAVNEPNALLPSQCPQERQLEEKDAVVALLTAKNSELAERDAEGEPLTIMCADDDMYVARIGER
jgi:hypothetical protein